MVSETLSGIPTIRSFNVVDLFVNRFGNMLDQNNRPLYLILITQRWIQLRLEIMNSILVLIATIFAIIFRQSIGLSNTGVLITYALQVTATFSWVIKTGIWIINGRDRH